VAPKSESSSSLVELKSRLATVTEGYRPGDLWSLARKIFADVASKYAMNGSKYATGENEDKGRIFILQCVSTFKLSICLSLYS
jgi:hypothetical protein